MFRYRLHLEDGSDAGEATYAQMIRAGRGDHRRHQQAVPRARRRPVRGGGLAVRWAASSRSGLDTRALAAREIGAARRPKGKGTCGPWRRERHRPAARQPASRRKALGSTSRVISLAPLYKRLTLWRRRLLQGRVRRWRQGGVCGSRLAYEAVAAKGDVTASYFGVAGQSGVLVAMPFDEEDESPFVELLQVEAA
jgi:hypothetical protein